jgi:hypothetical protein
MMTIETLSEFSRDRCGSLCAFLVPANVLTALATLYFLYRGRSGARTLVTVSLGLFFATVMYLHIVTWLAIGVVMAPTFVLFALASVCLVLQLGAVLAGPTLARSLRSAATSASGLINRVQESDRAARDDVRRARSHAAH